MINLLIGPPGGGKSYEAVVFHILPALKQGRKVITNLPVNAQAFAALDPAFVDLLDLRTNSKAGTLEKFVRPFSVLADYGDTWRHPNTGSGPLYVIDECHEAIPRMTASVEVMEWFAKHRHESADVLLVTQSYGKLHQDIRDMVQLVYRVKKATAFGFSTRYIRKVQDGLRGDVVNTTQREYQKQFFPLYQSHTKGGGQELEAQDVKPIWMRWPFLGTAACALLLIVMVFTLDLRNPFAPEAHAGKSQAQKLVTAGVSPAHVTPVAQQPKAPPAPPPLPLDPFEGRGLHLVGEITFGDSPKRTVFAVSQGGQGVTMLTLDQILQAGYSFTSYGPCAGMLDYRGRQRAVLCDAPTIAVQIPLG